jgi:hypothetical protein
LSVADATIAAMPLADYFSAPDDEAALAVLRTEGGPTRTGHDPVCLRGVDPVLALVRLEAALTGCGHEEAGARPRSGQVLSDPEDGPPFVVAVTDTLREALAHAREDDLARAAARWQASGEPPGLTTETASGALTALSTLARRAHDRGHRLYCWWSL